MGRTTFFYARRSLVALSLALALGGCEEDGTSPQWIPMADATVSTPGTTSLALRLEDGTLGAMQSQPGPVRVVATENRGSGRIDLDVPADAAWPVDLDVEVPAGGTWQVTAWMDRGGDGGYDGCPFPHAPVHTELADSYDNIVGVAEAAGGRDAPTPVVLHRRSCGPGDIETGVEGELVLPDGVELDDVPVRAVLVAEDDAEPQDADDVEMPRARALRVDLLGGPASARTPFRLTELVPGRYRLHVFTDHDGDGTPSPCGEPGGADRYVAPETVIDVEAATITTLPELRLEPAECPEHLTGVRGRVEAQDLDLADHAGQLRVEAVPVDGGPAVADRALTDDLSARPLPHPFTVTGLPAGVWRLHIYVDGDGDRRFTPCSGALAGFDALFATLDDVIIAPGEVLELGDIPLEPAGCDPSPGIAGVVDVEVEPGPLASGRPVRLALTPLDEVGEPRTVTLFADHVDLDDTGGRFGRRVAAGRYEARFYVDTDRDGAYVPCTIDPFGDRAHSPPFEVELMPGEVLEFGAPVELTSVGCDAPKTVLAPVLELDAVYAGTAPDAVELVIEEAGGWRTDLSVVLDPALGDELAVDPIELLPGHYTVTAFVDGDGDGQVDACDDADSDPYQDRVELTLDAMNADARPRLRPAPCPHAH